MDTRSDCRDIDIDPDIQKQQIQTEFLSAVRIEWFLRIPQLLSR